MKTYTVTATLNGSFHVFAGIEAANKQEAIFDAQASLSATWSSLDTAIPVYIDTEYSEDEIEVELADLFGQDLLDQIVENYCDVAQWEAVKEKK